VDRGKSSSAGENQLGVFRESSERAVTGNRRQARKFLNVWRFGCVFSNENIPQNRFEGVPFVRFLTKMGRFFTFFSENSLQKRGKLLAFFVYFGYN
jgi:hypothetical protein